MVCSKKNGRVRNIVRMVGSKKKLGGSGNTGWENGKPGSGTESSPGITLMPEMENVTLVDLTDCGQRRLRFWDECPFSGQVIIAGMFAVSQKKVKWRLELVLL